MLAGFALSAGLTTYGPMGKFVGRQGCPYYLVGKKPTSSCHFTLVK